MILMVKYVTHVWYKNVNDHLKQAPRKKVNQVDIVYSKSGKYVNQDILCYQQHNSEVFTDTIVRYVSPIRSVDLLCQNLCCIITYPSSYIILKVWINEIPPNI